MQVPDCAVWHHDVGGDTPFSWIHLDLTREETRTWIKSAFEKTVADHLLEPETRPRHEPFGSGFLVNLRGVNLNEGSDIEDMVSLRLWITDDVLITARLRKLRTVETLHERFESSGITSSWSTLVALADGLTDRIATALAEMDDKVDMLEEVMFDRSPDISHNVTVMRKQVIKLRRFVGPQRVALTKISADERLSNKDKHLVFEAVNRATHNLESLDAGRDRLTILQEHLDAHQNAALGRNSYVLSVAAAIFLPLGFITGLFGVNVAGMLGIQSPMAFWLLCAGCTAIGLALFLIFRWKRWL